MHLASTDNLYAISIDASAHASYCAEAFEVCIGTSPSPEAMTDKVIDQNAVSNLDYETFTGSFGIGTPGDYYVGIHIKSKKAAGSFRLTLQDLYITYTDKSAAVPAQVSNLSASAALDGTLFADVTFTMPSLTVNGKALDSSTKLTATIASPTTSVTAEGTPGQTITKRVAANEGLNQIEVTVASAVGESPVAVTSVRCGYDIPLNPIVSKSISADNMTLSLSWEPVAEGVNGGVVDPSKVTYNVYTYASTTDEQGNQMGGWIPFQSGIKECKFEFTASETLQNSYEFIVASQNSAGESEGEEGSYASARLGTPYILPMTEDISVGAIALAGYAAEYPDDTYNAIWGFNMTSGLVPESGNYGALVAISNLTEPTKGQMALPKFSGKGKQDLIFTMDIWLDGLTPLTEVYVETSKGDFTKLGEIRPAGDMVWKEFQFTLPASCNDIDWGSIVLRTSFVDPTQTLMVRSYSVRQLYARDLALTTPHVDNARVGETMTLSVTASNVGTQAMTATAPKAYISDGSKPLATVEFLPASATLQPGEKADFSASYLLNRYEFGGRTLTIEFDLDADDEDLDNNTVTLEIMPGQSSLPMVTDLQAKVTEAKDGVVLTWTNPISDILTESFESFTHGDHPEKIGEWSNFDLDGKECYTAQEAPFPDAVSPKAFQVINGDILGAPGFEAADGYQHIMAFSAQGAATDDWLISPEINPAGGLSFMTRILDPNYPETIKVLVSSTDTDFDSFKPHKTLQLTQTGWQQHLIDLPADTKFVAINYCSNDKFAVMLDCISYTPAVAPFVFESFTVYRNDAKVADSLTDETYSYIKDDFDNSNYNVSVVGTRHDGSAFESPMSNTAVVRLSGLSEIVAGQGKVTGSHGMIHISGYAPAASAVIADMAGRHMVLSVNPDGSLTIPAAPGIYIVRIGRDSHKVTVL